MYGTDVYADILFLVNLSMDYLCFYLTNGILHRKPRAFRMLLASVLGAFYAVAAVFLPVGKVTAFLADITVCAVMCAIVYAKRGEAFRNYLVSTGVYFGISALLGGLMTAFCSLLNHLGLPLEVIGKDGLSAWLFALLAAVSAAVAGTVGKFFRKSAGEQTATVGINCRGREVSLRAKVDSGNLLRDPVSGKPVILTALHPVSVLLPPGLAGVIRRGDFTSEDFRSACGGLRIRLIPSHTATGDGMLIGILPERVTVTDSRGTREIDALFAPTDLRVPGYEALLPPETDL